MTLDSNLLSLNWSCNHKVPLGSAHSERNRLPGECSMRLQLASTVCFCGSSSVMSNQHSTGDHSSNHKQRHVHCGSRPKGWVFPPEGKVHELYLNRHTRLNCSVTDLPPGPGPIDS